MRWPRSINRNYIRRNFAGTNFFYFNKLWQAFNYQTGSVSLVFHNIYRNDYQKWQMRYFHITSHSWKLIYQKQGEKQFVEWNYLLLQSHLKLDFSSNLYYKVQNRICFIKRWTWNKYRFQISAEPLTLR